MKIKCEYCNSTNDSALDDCRNCGAPLPISKNMDGLVQEPPKYNPYLATGMSIMAIATATTISGTTAGYILNNNMLRTTPDYYQDYYPEMGSYYDVIEEKEKEQKRRWQELEDEKRRKAVYGDRNYSKPIIVPKVDTNISREIPKKIPFWKRIFR